MVCERDAAAARDYHRGRERHGFQQNARISVQVAPTTSQPFVRLFVTQRSGSYDSEADDGRTVLQVLSLSDRYMLPGLKRQCEAVLRSRLDQVFILSSTALATRNRALSSSVAVWPCCGLLTCATPSTCAKRVWHTSLPTSRPL
jgi:hypothetical protein